MLKKFVSVILAAAILVSFTAGISAAERTTDFKWLDVYTFCSSEVANSKVSMQTVNGKHYLFLPSGISAESVPLYFQCSTEPESVSLLADGLRFEISSGQSVHLYELLGDKHEYPITLLAKLGDQEIALELSIVLTNHIGSMFLVSDDPVNYGRAWVESSPDKSNKATGAMFMLGADGSIVYDGILKQIKGRGNSTWLADKKPYQIKLDKKTDLLQTGDSDNKSKTWVLLTDAVDPTLLRNNIVYDLSVAAGLQPGIQCEPVNLFYDGEYRGAYLLCEKVEINSGRVDITDLEAENEAMNPDITDYDSLTIASSKTKNGATYIYCNGITNPSNLTGGYLLEMDTEVRAKQEKCYFITTRNNYIVVKSPEYCSKDEMNYIASYYQEFEDTLFSKGTNPSNGKRITDYVTMESLANCYLINELTKNPDGYRTSSYLYKDADSDIMTVGPIWDYDLSFGLSFGDFIESAQRTDGLFTIYSHIGRALYEIPEFRQEVHDIYLNKFVPLISNVLISGSESAAPLQSFAAYKAEISNAAYADGIVWGISEEVRDAHYAALLKYISARNIWLGSTFGKWSADSYELLDRYADVTPDAWYYEDVTKATDYGILNGMANGIFAPNSNTTRAQAAKVLFEVSGADRVAYSPIFSDVTNTAWYAPAVMWASRNNVVLGYEDHTFRPDDPITRQDFIVLMYRYLGSPATTENRLTSYSDSFRVSSYAYQALEWAVEVDLLRGYEDNTIRPENLVTRNELAALIVRFYESFVKE